MRPIRPFSLFVKEYFAASTSESTSAVESLAWNTCTAGELPGAHVGLLVLN